MGIFGRLNSAIRQWMAGPEPTGPLPAYRILSGRNCSIGNYRENNEDRVLTNDEQMIYIVADGMGGQAAGEQASQMAVEIVPRLLRESLVDGNEVAQVRSSIKDAVLAANQAIIDRGTEDPTTQNMGTTIVLGLCWTNRMFVAHLGDSRAYVVRQGQIRRITTDHNLAQALYEANSISEEELGTHRFRHMLWKFLGSKEVVDGPDIAEIELADGDRFLMATDGLTGSLSDDMIRDEIMKARHPQECADRLVRLALDHGSRDNVSGIVLFVTGPPKPPDPYDTDEVRNAGQTSLLGTEPSLDS